MTYHAIKPGWRILGHGIDLIEPARLQRLIGLHGQRFLDRCFLPQEQAYAAANPRRQAEHLAGRFAAKEAVFKALGTGWSGGIRFSDVEVIRQPGGRPDLKLHGRCSQVAHNLGIQQWWISLTHVRQAAMASVIAVGPDLDPPRHQGPKLA